MATSRGDHAASDLAVLPSYPQMIVEAIASLREDNGSSQAAIARRIEAAHGAAGHLPPSHPALVAAHLSRMSAAADLVAVAGGKYALPPPPPPPPAAARHPVEEDEDLVEEEEDYDDDEDSPDDAPPPPPPPPPAKRGRGRPPKVRPPGFPHGAPAAAVGAPSSGGAGDGLPVPAAAPAAPRRRGRPPKPRDPHAPPKIARPRGRPRKNPLPEGLVPIPRPGSTASKPRPQFAEVGFV